MSFFFLKKPVDIETQILSRNMLGEGDQTSLDVLSFLSISIFLLFKVLCVIFVLFLSVLLNLRQWGYF